MKAEDLKPGDLFIKEGRTDVFLVIKYCDYADTLDERYMGYEEKRVYAIKLTGEPELFGFRNHDHVNLYTPFGE